MEIPALPTLPTDNYYKFKAIAGVWLVVVFYILNWVGIFYVQQERFEVLVRAATLKADSDELKDDLKVDEVHVKQLEAESAEIESGRRDIQSQREKFAVAGKPSATLLDAIREQESRLEARNTSLGNRLSTIRKELDERRAKERKIRRDTALVSIAERRAEVLSIEALILGSVLLLQAIFGFALAFSGFSDWRRLQALEDSVLRKKLSGELT